MTLAELYDPIAESIRGVQRICDDELAAEVPAVNELCAHLRNYHGKMLRPTLVLLTGRAVGDLTPDHLVLGAVVELVHLATLVHDDVLDEAELRRRCPTINALRGNEAAVLLGDYLISHAFHLCSSLDSQYASRLIGSTTNTVCEGELMQVAHRGDFTLSEEVYLQILSRKTASLIATCCVLGARYAGGDASTIARMESYGMNVGLAFQIADDILDLMGDAAAMGKTLGRDLDKDKMTLPLIHFLRTADAQRRALALDVLGNGHLDRADRLRDLVVDSDSVDYARQRARHYARAAASDLGDLPESDAKDTLQSVAEMIVDRQT